MGFSRQEHWSRLPFPPPGDFPNSVIESWVSYISWIASRFFMLNHQGSICINTFADLSGKFFFFKYYFHLCLFQCNKNKTVAQLLKNPPARDPSSIPGLGRSTGEGIGYPLQYSWASLVAQLVKNPPAMWEIWVWSLSWEDPLEKGKAPHSSILAWRIPWTIKSCKELDITERLSLSTG